MVTAGYEEYNDVKVVKVTIRLDFSTVLPYLISLFWYLQTCIRSKKKELQLIPANVEIYI